MRHTALTQAGYSGYGAIAPQMPGTYGSPTVLGTTAMGGSSLGGTTLGGTSASSLYGNAAGTGTSGQAPQPYVGGAPAAALPSIAGADTGADTGNGKNGNRKGKQARDGSEAPAEKAVSARTRTLPEIGDRLSGHPSAVDGATLAYDGIRYSILGVQAPTLSATCASGGTVWRCGEDSRDDLARFASALPIECLVTAGGTTPKVSCETGRSDLASLLVRDGSVFPDRGTMGRELAEARTDGRGIWAGH